MMKITLRWLVLCASPLVLIPPVCAAPVTLRFEGTITELDVVGSPVFTLPGGINNAKPAILTLAFEPAPFPQSAETVGAFSSPGGTLLLTPVAVQLRFGGHALASSIAQMFIEHDPLSPSTGGGAGIIEREVVNIQASGTLTSDGPLSWTTHSGFVNQGSVLHGGENLGSPDLWNALPIHTLTTVFENAGLGSIAVTAEFGDALLVPEPAGRFLGLVALWITSPSIMRRSRVGF